MPPPPWRETMNELLATDARGAFVDILMSPIDDSAYLHWDKLRFKTPPEGFTHKTWWLRLKLSRSEQKRSIPLRDNQGSQFHYVLTDELLIRCESVTRRASGQISLPEHITSTGEKNRYIVNSLIEEAITSSQLEGAATSRRVAKQMIRSGREPVDKSERMILNNYRAMKRIQEIRDQPLTPDLILEIHRIVTDGTLDDPADAGRVQTDQSERISIWGDEEQFLYTPPLVHELPGRLQLLCTFANGTLGDIPYLPPPLRAIIVHFMMGYDHYFVDGNGRTARALFYWCMLHNGYWLTEYVTISRLLKNAPTQYATSFLLTEDDEGDLTHFLLYHTGIFLRALDDLETYLRHKATEARAVRVALNTGVTEFNDREIAILDSAVRDPDSEFSVRGHMVSHSVSHETARKDLQHLQDRGLLRKSKRARSFIWHPVADLGEQLNNVPTGVQTIGGDR